MEKNVSETESKDLANQTAVANARAWVKSYYKAIGDERIFYKGEVLKGGTITPTINKDWTYKEFKLAVDALIEEGFVYVSGYDPYPDLHLTEDGIRWVKSPRD